jgi:hypothetical protein
VAEVIQEIVLEAFVVAEGWQFYQLWSGTLDRHYALRARIL